MTTPFDTAPATTPASDAQRDYVARLTADRAALYRGHGRDLAAELVVHVSFDAELADRKATSALIDRMIAANVSLRAELGPMPTTKGCPQATDDVIEGRYAVERGGVLKFYRVARPTEGKWAGHTFVSAVHSDDETNLRPRFATDVIEAIHAAGAEACAVAYGREFKRCGICGRGLTNESSRAAGIGPICATKF